MAASSSVRLISDAAVTLACAQQFAPPHKEAMSTMANGDNSVQRRWREGKEAMADDKIVIGRGPQAGLPLIARSAAATATRQYQPSAVPSLRGGRASRGYGGCLSDDEVSRRPTDQWSVASRSPPHRQIRNCRRHAANVGLLPLRCYEEAEAALAASAVATMAPPSSSSSSSYSYTDAPKTNHHHH